MMNRSIVTTEVAVCFTTLCVLIGCRSGLAPEAVRGVTARVGLVAVCVVTPPQTLPNVMKGKHLALPKLLDVPKFVQQQLGIEPGFRCQENGVTQRNRSNGGLSQHPASNSERQSSTTEPECEELRILPC